MRRSPNPADQRSHILSLTASGLGVYQEVAPLALKVQAQILEGFTPQEIESLSRLLVRAEAAATPSDQGRRGGR
ncbi:hypothetical protein D9M72_626080 [compost metagenome]